jgi:hypothetical protein
LNLTTFTLASDNFKLLLEKCYRVSSAEFLSLLSMYRLQSGDLWPCQVAPALALLQSPDAHQNFWQAVDRLCLGIDSISQRALRGQTENLRKRLAEHNAGKYWAHFKIGE